jgi:hypothetical protein
MFKNKKNIALILLLSNSVLMGSGIGEDALKQFQDDIAKSKEMDEGEVEEKEDFNLDPRNEIKETVEDIKESISTINLMAKISLVSSLITTFMTLLVFGIYASARNP